MRIALLVTAWLLGSPPLGILLGRAIRQGQTDLPHRPRARRAAPLARPAVSRAVPG